MTHRSLIFTLALMATAAHAQVLKDPQWQAWLDNGRTGELTQAAQARLTAQPDDVQAAIALALAAVDEGQPARLEAVLKPVQACVEKQAPQAACFYALGAVQGVQAMSGGNFKSETIPVSAIGNNQVKVQQMLDRVGYK